MSLYMDGLNRFLILSYVFLSYFLMFSYFLMSVLRFLIKPFWGPSGQDPERGRQVQTGWTARTDWLSRGIRGLLTGVASYYVVLLVSGCRKGDPKTKVLGKNYRRKRYIAEYRCVPKIASPEARKKIHRRNQQMKVSLCT